MFSFIITISAVDAIETNINIRHAESGTKFRVFSFFFFLLLFGVTRAHLSMVGAVFREA